MKTRKNIKIGIHNSVLRAIRQLSMLAMGLLTILAGAIPVYADENSGTTSSSTGIADPQTAINNFNKWLLGIFASVGVTVVVYGIYQLVTTWASHDMTQRLNAILIIIGGIILMGISVVIYTITGVKIN